jgi:hypothetical protein
VLVGFLTKRKGLYFGEHKISSLLAPEEDKKSWNSPPFLVRTGYCCCYAIMLALEPGLLWPYVLIYSVDMRQLFGKCPWLFGN